MSPRRNDDLVTRLASDLQGLSVDELSQRLAAAEAAQTKEASGSGESGDRETKRRGSTRSGLRT